MSQGSDGYEATSVSFSEEAAGYIDFDQTAYDAAFHAGRAARRRLGLQLRITADDVDRCIAEERATARVAGWLRADGTRRMDYRLRFHDGADRPLTLVGFKEVRGELADVGPALYTRLLAGHVDAPDEAT